MTDIMIDLETLGTRPSCVVLSLGAIVFNAETNLLGDMFYSVFHTYSQVELGLHENPETIAWWEKQSDAARRVLEQAATAKDYPLAKVLGNFTTYLDEVGNLSSRKLWGNGSDFDNAILAHLYHVAGLRQPWYFWNNRCYRTLKGVAGALAVKPPLRTGTYHHALDDAKTQAQHAMVMMRALNRLHTRGVSP